MRERALSSRQGVSEATTAPGAKRRIKISICFRLHVLRLVHVEWFFMQMQRMKCGLE